MPTLFIAPRLLEAQPLTAEVEIELQLSMLYAGSIWSIIDHDV